MEPYSLPQTCEKRQPTPSTAPRQGQGRILLRSSTSTGAFPDPVERRSFFCGSVFSWQKFDIEKPPGYDIGIYRTLVRRFWGGMLQVVGIMNTIWFQVPDLAEDANLLERSLTAWSGDLLVLLHPPHFGGSESCSCPVRELRSSRTSSRARKCALTG